MPATLYLRPSPRAFFLLTPTHALVFRQPDATESKASRSVVVAEFLPLDEVDVRGMVMASRGRTVEGVLGVTSVPSERSPIPDIFLLLLSSYSPLSPLLPSSSLRPARVLGVEFHSLTSSFWDPPDLVASINSAYPINDLEDGYDSTSLHSTQSTTQSQAQQQGLEHPCMGMRKYLESGSFFFAEECKWDISTRMGDANWVHAEQGRAGHPLETFDERFVWNSTLLAPLLAFRSGLPPDVRQELDEQSVIVPIIQGFCGSTPVSTGAWSADGRPEVAALGIISRLSWKRAGARFRTRGIDDDGQVANFVETEVILATDSVCMSYVEIRGSVPLFWQQPSTGIQTLQQKVEITRPPQATQPAFDKHFIELLEHYHSVHAVNLLGQRDAEAMLSAAYSDHLEQLKETLETHPLDEKALSNHDTKGSVDLTAYDFHAAIRANGQDAPKYDFSTRLRGVVDSTERFGWTAIDASSGQIIEKQQGVFRVNCLDCLDRTNYIQDVISSITLAKFLQSIGSPLQNNPTLWSAHRQLWADNGDRLSKIYAGTGALNTSATRSGKKTFAGLLSDATKSVGRSALAYITNFQDKGKQNAIDLLLGMIAGQRPVILFDPIGDSVQTALAARVEEYSQVKPLTIFSGTWNLNGVPPHESLNDWLFPPNVPDADIYMIAFQEIVELTPGQILQTDPAKRRMWEQAIMDSFNARSGKHPQYLLYRSEQLVGTALIVVIRAELTSGVRNVESATKKTGLQGLSGNKGGVGIRLDLFDTSICLMTCHLAAGQSNVAERNADYRTISEGLKFLRGKIIEDHDIIIWAADFVKTLLSDMGRQADAQNYRVAMPNLDVRALVERGDLDALIGADQVKLKQAIDDGEVFVGYDEGPLTFHPTYKYDNGTDTYDTSEKQRVPAWTDRILFRGDNLQLESYGRAELQMSDHRPVYAVLRAAVRQVDEARKSQITQEIMRSIGGNPGGDRLDARIERGAKQGMRPLVELLTSTSLSNGNKPIPALTKAPALPPRPARTPSLPSPDRITPPVAASRPPTGVVARYLTSISQNDNSPPPTAKPHSVKRKPPPVPDRQLSASSMPIMQASTSADRRPAPAIARKTSISSLNSSHSRMLSSSPTPSMTPSSTGEYIIVKSPSERTHASDPARPPPLPARQAPAISPPRAVRVSLDLDAPPPGGLIAPAVPDVVVKSLGPPNSPKKAKPPPPVAAKPKALRSTSGSAPMADA